MDCCFVCIICWICVNKKGDMIIKPPKIILVDGLSDMSFKCKVIPSPDGIHISPLRAKYVRMSTLIMTTHGFFNSPVCREYVRKVSVHLIQKYFPYDCRTDSFSFSERKKGI